MYKVSQLPATNETKTYKRIHEYACKHACESGGARACT